jgi:excisionase family DNA binding protein
MAALIDLTPLERGHLAVALRVHQKWLRENGRQAPAGIVELQRWCQSRVSEGQEGSELDTLVDIIHDAVSKLLWTPTEVGKALSCSQSTVKRLIGSGELPSIKVGNARRISVTDLKDFIEKSKGSAQ